MADLLARELSKGSFRSNLAHSSRLFEGGKSTKFALAHSNHPSVPRSIIGNALNAAGVIGSRLAIAQIVKVTGKPQVFDSVVRADAIDVINIEPAGDAAMHIDPCQPMGILRNPSNVKSNVSIGNIYGSTWLPNLGLVSPVHRFDAYKLSSHLIVGAKLLESFLRNIHCITSGVVPYEVNARERYFLGVVSYSLLRSAKGVR